MLQVWQFSSVIRPSADKTFSLEDDLDELDEEDVGGDRLRWGAKRASSLLVFIFKSTLEE